jgi:hypothetical protein
VNVLGDGIRLFGDTTKPAHHRRLTSVSRDGAIATLRFGVARAGRPGGRYDESGPHTVQAGPLFQRMMCAIPSVLRRTIKRTMASMAATTKNTSRTIYGMFPVISHSKQHSELLR